MRRTIDRTAHKIYEKCKNVVYFSTNKKLCPPSKINIHVTQRPHLHINNQVPQNKFHLCFYANFYFLPHSPIPFSFLIQISILTLHSTLIQPKAPTTRDITHAVFLPSTGGSGESLHFRRAIRSREVRLLASPRNISPRRDTTVPSSNQTLVAVSRRRAAESEDRE